MGAESPQLHCQHAAEIGLAEGLGHVHVERPGDTLGCRMTPGTGIWNLLGRLSSKEGSLSVFNFLQMLASSTDFTKLALKRIKS